MNLNLPTVILIIATVASAPHTVSGDGKLFRDDLTQLAKEWFDIGDIFQSFLYPTKEKVTSFLTKPSTLSGVSPRCQKSIKQLSRDILDNKLWAVEMLDNSAAHSSGFLRRWVEFGDYDTCIDISNSQYLSPLSQDIAINGQYCMVSVKFSLPNSTLKDSLDSIDLSPSERYAKGHWLERSASIFKILYFTDVQFSLCAPSTCLPHELETMINNNLPKKMPFFARIEPLSCSHTGQEDVLASPSLKKIQRGAQLILLLMTSIVVCSPFILKYKPNSFFRHFDIITNTQKLTSTTNDPLAGKLVWVHGARILYLLLAISFHLAVLAALWTPQTQSKYIFTKYNIKCPLWEEFFANMTIGISVNFTIGGMLTFISWYPELVRAKGSLSFAKYLLARWIRTLPLVTGALLILLATPITFATGPVWKIGWSKVVNNCLTNWLSEYMYTSNMLPIRSSCLPYAWYLSVDMQLYVLSFILVLIIFKSFKRGLYLAIATCLAAVLYHGYYLHVNSLKYTADYSSTDIQRLLEREIVLHTGAFNYISSYTIGIVLGYLIASGFKIESQFTRTVGWFFFVGLGLSIHLIPLIWKKTNGPPSRTQELIFGSLQRTIYSIAYSYGFLLGSNNQAGFINSMANWPWLVPLGRLASSTFIGHFFVIWYETFTTRHAMHFDMFSLTKRFTHTTVFALCIGYYIYIVFEAPFLNLGKSLISSRKDRKEKKGKEE